MAGSALVTTVGPGWLTVECCIALSIPRHGSRATPPASRISDHDGQLTLDLRTWLLSRSRLSSSVCYQGLITLEEGLAHPYYASILRSIMYPSEHN